MSTEVIPTTEVVATTESTATTAQLAPEASSTAPILETPKIGGLDALKAKAKEFEAKQAAGTTAPENKIPGEVQSKATPAVAPPANAFAPNFKYKAFDKEYEIDDFLKPAIKDADTEKKVKDILSKSQAFDDYKQRHLSLNENFEKLYYDHDALDRDVRKVMNFRNTKDYDNFFNSLQIPKQDIYDWVVQQIELEKASPEQRMQYQNHLAQRQKSYDLEHENQTLSQQYQDQSLNIRNIQLDMSLSKPDVSEIAQAWDQKTGKSGAFRSLVVEEAQRVWAVSQKDLPADEAVQMVLQKYGSFFDGLKSAPAQAMPQTPTQQAPTPQAQAPQVVVEQKPVIPIIAGKGTSPVQKRPRNLEELKQMAKQAQA